MGHPRAASPIGAPGFGKVQVIPNAVPVEEIDGAPPVTRRLISNQKLFISRLSRARTWKTYFMAYFR
jgi:hypothetical protein